MADIDETAAVAPTHEFQVVHRMGWPGQPGSWSQYQSAWSNAADTWRALVDLVLKHDLDAADMFRSAATWGTAAMDATPSQSPTADATGHPGAATEPQGL